MSVWNGGKRKPAKPVAKARSPPRSPASPVRIDVKARSPPRSASSPARNSGKAGSPLRSSASPRRNSSKPTATATKMAQGHREVRSVHRSVDDWITTIMEARTTQMFTGAFNALLKQECPSRTLRLVVITPGHDDDSVYWPTVWKQRLDLQRSGQLSLCTYWEHNPWGPEAKNRIGLYLVDGTVCAASIEVEIDKDFVGSIYAKTIESRQSLDMYNLLMAATVIYTASIAVQLHRHATHRVNVDTLHSSAVVLASMWVLRPYSWLSPTQEQFDKKRNSSYEAYDKYFRQEVSVEISFRPRDNVKAAGDVLAHLFRKKKFCHSRSAAAAEVPDVVVIDLTYDVIDLRGGFGAFWRNKRRTRRASRPARGTVRRHIGSVLVKERKDAGNICDGCPQVPHGRLQRYASTCATTRSQHAIPGACSSPNVAKRRPWAHAWPRARKKQHLVAVLVQPTTHAP